MQCLTVRTFLTSWGKWMILGVIPNLICKPRSEMGRPAFVASYGGSLIGWAETKWLAT